MIIRREGPKRHLDALYHLKLMTGPKKFCPLKIKKADECDSISLPEVPMSFLSIYLWWPRGACNNLPCFDDLLIDCCNLVLCDLEILAIFDLICLQRLREFMKLPWESGFQIINVGLQIRTFWCQILINVAQILQMFIIVIPCFFAPFVCLSDEKCSKAHNIRLSLSGQSQVSLCLLRQTEPKILCLVK